MQQYARERWERRQKRYRQIELPDDDKDDDDASDDDEPQPVIMRTDVDERYVEKAPKGHSSQAMENSELRYGEEKD